MAKSILSKLLLLIIISGGLFFGYRFVNNSLYEIPDNSPTGKYKLSVKTGDNLNTVALKLKQDNIVNNPDFLPFLAKTSVNPDLRSGVYELDLPATPENILKQLNDQKPKPADNTISVSLLEGDTAEDIAAKLEKSGIIKQQTFLSYIQDYKNFSLDEFPFLPSQNINCEFGKIYQNCPKYYLEGYLFPDTYNFYVDSKPDVVANKFLKNFNTKIWLKYQNKLSSKNAKEQALELNQKIILASVVEREVGRNFIKAMISDTDIETERCNVAGVYLNRLNKKIKWQSDPTVWYGVDQKKGVTIDGDLGWGNAKYKTGYNTYIMAGYPVGPIANPGEGAILASFNPASHDFLFFVSDRSGKMYFAVTNDEHEQNKVKVREINKSLPSL